MILSIATLLNISILQNNFYYDLYREFQRFRQFPNQRRLLNLFLLKTKIPNNIDERLLKVVKYK